MNEPLAIQARDVQKHFGTGPSSVVALRDLSLELTLGCLAVVMGPSGSGKSSLLAALGGLQKPDQGDVLAFGQSVWRNGVTSARHFRRTHCGFVFQSHGMFPALGARAQIAAPLVLLGLPRQEALRRADEALSVLGLSDRRNALPSELSGGQNQRVAIARMLAKKASLLFCDEPTSALDSANGRLVGELLRTFAHTRNSMVLCVTHDERLAAFADRVMTIEDGQMALDDKVKNA